MPRHSCCEVRVMQLHDILLLRTSAILVPIVYLFVFALYIEYNALHIAKNAFNV